MSLRVFRGSLPLVLLFCFFSITGYTQTFRGGITGAVTDPSGAAIGGANVQAVNISTGLRRDAVSSDAGDFALQDLPLGEYEVTATHPGFDQIKI